MVDVEKLAEKAARVAAERNANLEAAAREKREAVSVLEKILQGVKDAVPAVSEKVLVAHAEQFRKEPVLRFEGKGVKVLGDGPQGIEEFGDAEIKGADVFLLDDGTLMHLHYAGKKERIRDFKWNARALPLSPVDFVEKYGARSVETLATAVERALDRHNQGGRSRRTAQHEAAASGLGALAQLLGMVFAARR